MENTMKFLKKLKTEVPYDLGIQLLGIHLKKMTTLVQNNTCTTVFIAESRYGINLSVPQQMNGQKGCGISSSVASDSTTPRTADAYIYIHTMEYYSAIRKNEIFPFVRTWLDLEVSRLMK